MGRLTLILGGAKSGKTGYGLLRCQAFPGPRIYLATSQAWDDEMKERIQRHQAERGEGWQTIEEPLDPAGVLKSLEPGGATVVLLDCLTLWLSNLMAGEGLNVDEAVARTRELARAAALAPCPVFIVSNEVGLGIVPENRLARQFRDASGASHQILAEAAEEAWWVVAGLPQKLKG